MKHKLFLLVLTLSAILIAGCSVVSFYPLFEEAHFVQDDRLLGTWTDGEGSTWQISAVREEKKRYKILHTDERGNTATFIGTLGKIGDLMFLDTFWEPSKEQNEMTMSYLIKAHVFSRLAIQEDSLVIHHLDYESIEEEQKTGRLSLKALQHPSGQLILHATTAELQAFFLQHGEKAALYDDPLVLRKAKQD